MRYGTDHPLAKRLHVFDEHGVEQKLVIAVDPEEGWYESYEMLVYTDPLDRPKTIHSNQLVRGSDGKPIAKRFTGKFTLKLLNLETSELEDFPKKETNDVV